jgi:hypothetical protein
MATHTTPGPMAKAAPLTPNNVHADEALAL